eukprot:TRINITY_DN7839_c0_g1_i10.p2 TRINITY_DN7839_c0_g1~~TRINITY_DN7839_c0_g1_i10.p2  ORF type:complete len:376 (+),score=96.36 TRINITY_DN7839_c0_g1_i10:60-1187(+)
MHKRNQTSILEPKLPAGSPNFSLNQPVGSQAMSTKVNKALVDKMVQKYFSYVNRLPKKSKRGHTNQDSPSSSAEELSFSELSEGPVLMPLQSHVKVSAMEHCAKNQICTQAPASYSKLPSKKIDAKKIVSYKQKKEKLNLHKVIHKPALSGIPFEPISTNFLKEMIKHGLDKEISSINCRKVWLTNSPRNDQLKDIPSTSESGSTQITNNSHTDISTSKNKGKYFIFPYQRRNRSCSPEKIELSISGLAKTPSALNVPPPKPGPIIAKNFLFGAQVKASHSSRSKEGMQVLRAISKSQERAGEKQCIIEDLDEEMMVNEVVEKVEQVAIKEVERMEMPKVIKAQGRGRHRRVTSQVMDKQTLQKLLMENKENLGF